MKRLDWLVLQCGVAAVWFGVLCIVVGFVLLAVAGAWTIKDVVW